MSTRTNPTTPYTNTPPQNRHIEQPLIKDQQTINFEQLTYPSIHTNGNGAAQRNQDRASGVDLLNGGQNYRGNGNFGGQQQYGNFGNGAQNPERKYQNQQNPHSDRNRKASNSSGSDQDKNQPNSQERPVSKCYYYVSLAIWIAALQGIGALVGFTTNSGNDGWYGSAQKPPLNPPGIVFGIVWPILYFLIAVAGWILQFAPEMPKLTLIRVLFGIQLVLNWSWSYVFFTFQLTGLGFGIILTMIIAVGTIIILSFEKIRAVSVLLLPYILWLCFACYLNCYIWLKN